MKSTRPQITTYLDDLARMLVDIDAAERDDILGGIRSHLEGSQDIHDAIIRLGPPEQVAAAARAELLPGVAAPPPPQASSRLSTGWARTGVSLLGMALIALPLLHATGRISQVVGDGAGIGDGMFGPPLIPHAPELLIGGVLLLAPVWLSGVALVALAGRIQPATRVVLTAAGPASFILIAVSWLALPGPSIAAGVLLLAITVALGGLVVRAWQGIGR